MQPKFYAVQRSTGKRISFGAKGYEDYTTHHDEARRQRFLSRFKKLIKTAERSSHPEFHRIFWSAGVLWNKPTVEGSFRNLKKRYPQLREWKIIAA